MSLCETAMSAVLYAFARDFVLDHAKPYDDSPGLLPIGQVLVWTALPSAAHCRSLTTVLALIPPLHQAHGQDNYLLGTGNWTFALRLCDDVRVGVGNRHLLHTAICHHQLSQSLNTLIVR